MADQNPGVLHVVAMPLGSADDISARAVKILSDADGIACEDTRKARDWFTRCGITPRGRLFAYHEHNERNSAAGLIALLEQGQNLALISDAGTPRISDPGHELLKLCAERKIPVRPVPGPSALTAILSICPFGILPMAFHGFLSPKSGRRRSTLEFYLDWEGALVLFESVHRIGSLLEEMLDIFGDIRVFLGRDMTKDHEEYFLGEISAARAWVTGRKGEFALIIEKTAKKRSKERREPGK